MISPNQFLDFLFSQNVSFFSGVPDSQLKEFLDVLTVRMGIGKNHIIAANEGNAVGLAAGYHLATGKVPLVYMQNSGLGNSVNPITSLIDPKVYSIPMVFLVGWRGKPGIHDEPQHIKQGEITMDLLALLGIDAHVLSPLSDLSEIENVFQTRFNDSLSMGKAVAFVVEKGAFSKEQSISPSNTNILGREETIHAILSSLSPNDYVISTTGKISREIYEFREKNHQSHAFDFLTVGSMGHASMIALGVALNCPQKRIWCLDGDGAALMHLGALGIIGSQNPSNFVHVILNNFAHESVGGQPTVADRVKLTEIASSCGYRKTLSIKNKNELLSAISSVSETNELTFLEILVSPFSRPDLGRPKTTPVENKIAFESQIREK